MVCWTINVFNKPARGELIQHIVLLIINGIAIMDIKTNYSLKVLYISGHKPQAKPM